MKIRHVGLNAAAGSNLIFRRYPVLQLKQPFAFLLVYLLGHVLMNLTTKQIPPDMLAKLTFLPALLLSVFMQGQTTVVLQPDSTDGKDAMIWTLSSTNTTFGDTDNKNYGKHRDFIAHEWTWNGNVGTRYSLLQFDLNGLANAQIMSAELSLFYNPTSADPFHSQLSGSNECKLERIIDPWNEHTVTWNTQPGTTSLNALTLPASTSTTQDYLNIDVSGLVQDMVNDTSSSHGFMIKMATPYNYRRLVFASSDEPNESLRPKLEITYMSTVGINEHEGIEGLMLFPNPAKELVSVKWHNQSDTQLELRDLHGRMINFVRVNGSQHMFDLSELSAGVYIVQVRTNGNSESRRLIVQ